jgi:signal transduction histidine kinase
LDDLGLLPALSSYFRDFSRDNHAIFISPRITVSERDVPAELKLPLFRVVQGALSNVARHSKASAARVCLSMFEDELRLVIEDDGVGFDAEHWRRRRLGPGHCGLGMICRWVQGSGGHCTIEAAPRHGARVQALWRVAPAGSGARSGESANPSAVGVAERARADAPRAHA